jgi:hypothetical protein
MDNTTGTFNAALGYRAAFNVSTGCQNTASGYNALYCATTGCRNVAIGTNTGCVITTGHCNTAVGVGAGPNAAALNNTVALGNGATVTASNTTVIGNSSTTDTTIFGTVSAPDATFGAVMENNLASPGVETEPEGTILIWEGGIAKPSYVEYDSRVLGIVKEDSDKPIVLGAEPVLITGVISEGDFIVTSDKKGHGKKGVSNNLFGKVIAQALESGEGDSYTIKAMIRKF